KRPVRFARSRARPGCRSAPTKWSSSRPRAAAARARLSRKFDDRVYWRELDDEPAMSEPAIRGMTVDEFLRWEDGTDTRYELVGGLVVAMAPPAARHSRLAGRLGGAIDAALRARPPCGVYPEARSLRPAPHYTRTVS